MKIRIVRMKSGKYVIQEQITSVQLSPHITTRTWKPCQRITYHRFFKYSSALKVFHDLIDNYKSQLANKEVAEVMKIYG